MDYEDFESAGLTWEELQAIHDNYRGLERKLRGIGKDFVDEYLYDIEKAGIHSYRYRTKEPGHLIEKIIRKRNEHPEKFEKINSTNYCKYVTDLIGIRVFFLYREDWKHFHEYITSVFENNPEQYVEDREADFDGNEEHYYIAERPKVYRRTGDSRIYDESLIDINQTGFTVLSITLSSIRGITWRYRPGPCLKRGGARWIMILFIHISRTMRC